MPNTEPNLSVLTDGELAEHIQLAEADENAAKTARKRLNNELLTRRASELSALYGQKPEPYGIVNIKLGNKIAKIDTSKNVEWDQKQLEKLWNQILADGADPKQYLKVEYAVSETAYKVWGDNIKAFFSPARTVKARTPSIKILDKEE